MKKREGFETRREVGGYHHGKTFRDPENLKEAKIVSDLASELNRAYALLREGANVPPLQDLLKNLIPRYGAEKEKFERIADATVEIANRWNPPDITGHVLPDPRIVAMDSIKKGEALELRNAWDIHALPRKYNPSDDTYQLLLISCRALMIVQKYPDLYRFK